MHCCEQKSLHRMNFNFENATICQSRRWSVPNIGARPMSADVLIYITVIQNKSKLRNLSYKSPRPTTRCAKFSELCSKLEKRIYFVLFSPCLRCYYGSYCTIEINSKEVEPSAFSFFYF